MKNKGFTLLELLVYVGIFTIVAGIFVGILTITLRVQGTQTGLVEISGQLNFALQTVQRYIRDASIITAPAVGATASTLNLDGGAVTITLGVCGGVSEAICVNGEPVTNGKIRVSVLNFTHLVTLSSIQPPPPGAPDVHSVRINITADNKSANPENFSQRSLQSSASPL